MSSDDGIGFAASHLVAAQLAFVNAPVGTGG
jgi:hypothetical protein